MYLFVYDFPIQDLEGVQMDAFVERKDGVADTGVDGQTEVFLRGARGRGWMAVPIGEDLQAFASGVSQGCKLVLRGEGEVLWRVVDVFHPVVLGDYIAVRAAGAQQVAARLVGCVLPGLGYQFIYNVLWYNHCGSKLFTFHFHYL